MTKDTTPWSIFKACNIERNHKFGDLASMNKNKEPTFVHIKLDPKRNRDPLPGSPLFHFNEKTYHFTLIGMILYKRIEIMLDMLYSTKNVC